MGRDGPCRSVTQFLGRDRYGPTTSFTQWVQAITPHRPRSAGLLGDLREILRLVEVSLRGRRAGVKIGAGCPPTPVLSLGREPVG